MTAKLSASDLTLFRGDRCLFAALDFALDAGELLLLEGANGSGKTSLLRAISGLIELESGEIRWQGKPIGSQRQEYHAQVALMSHRIGCKPDLTLVDNLEFEAALRPQSNRDFVEVLECLEVDGLKRLPMRSLSAGQQRRVSLARLLLSDAQLWLMDEPFTNLDRDGRNLVVTLVGEHLRRGGLCILASHQDVAIEATTRRVTLQ